MSEYSIKPYEDVNNSQYNFHKLYIDGVCQYDDFLKEIERNANDKKLLNGILNSLNYE